MEQIKGEFGPFVIAGDDQYGYPHLSQIKKRLNQFMKCLLWDVVFVKEVSAMNEKIDFSVYGVLYDGQKILENGLGPFLSSLGVALGYPGNLKSQMGICRMNKLQCHSLTGCCPNPIFRTNLFELVVVKRLMMPFL